MAAFVGFDPLKTHKPQIVRFASLFIALASVCVVAYAHIGV